MSASSCAHRLKTHYQPVPRHIRRPLQCGKRDGRVVRVEQAANLRTTGMQAFGQFDLRHAGLFQQSDDYLLDGASLYFSRNPLVSQKLVKVLADVFVLKAQGLGNIVSGLIGGLPVTQVIVRSSANIAFGARSKLSAILHGVFILVCVIALPGLLNLIPLATLASILLVVGYKLAKPALFTQMYRHGWEQFTPFIATVVGILATDLLRGIGIGMLIGIAIILRHRLRNPFSISEHTPDSPEFRIQLAEEVSFLNKGRILQQLQSIPEQSHVVIDGTRSKVVDFDVLEILREFRATASARRIAVEIRGTILNPILQ